MSFVIGPPFPEGKDERPDISPKVRRWPDRMRCYECRSYLSFLVVDRLYCSWHCAGRPPDPEDPLFPQSRPGPDVPRQCTLAGRRRYKRRYPSLGDARRAANASLEPGIMAYECSYCGFFHIGHRVTDEIERLRQKIEELTKENRRLQKAVDRKYDRDKRALREISAAHTSSQKKKRARIISNRRVRKIVKTREKRGLKRNL